MSNKNSTLHNYERRFYFFTWISCVIYSIYSVYVTNIYFVNFYDFYLDFEPGWSWLKRNRDVSDEEWSTWISLAVKLIPWIIIHHCISQIIKKMHYSMLLCCWYILVSTSFLYYYFGILSMMCTLVQPFLLYFLTYTNNKTIIWLVHILFLFIIHFLKTPDDVFQQLLGLNNKEHYILTLSICWIQLRSVSQNIDSIEIYIQKKRSYYFYDLLQMLAYCLYLPTLFFGPLVLFHEFLDALNKPSLLWNSKKFGIVIINLIRYIFWLYFTELSLHFIYFNALLYYPEIVRELNPWALYGLGYCMGQFFLNKYVVIYGISSTLCKVDGIKAPPQPRCIGRIHLYSDMWKHFDRGLYKFLIRYIYIPALGGDSYHYKLFASFLCFTFVFVWHGMQINILIWAFLNFIGLTIESLARLLENNHKYITIKTKYLSSWNARRLNCALTSPLLAMSAISNFYFFAGQEIGNIYVQRILEDSWHTVLWILFSLYCCCHVSIDIKSWKI